MVHVMITCDAKVAIYVLQAVACLLVVALLPALLSTVGYVVLTLVGQALGAAAAVAMLAKLWKHMCRHRNTANSRQLAGTALNTSSLACTHSLACRGWVALHPFC
jgi:hypothetical protein